jgi:hypothetical protein
MCKASDASRTFFCKNQVVNLLPIVTFAIIDETLEFFAAVGSQPGLPDGIFSSQKSHFG